MAEICSWLTERSLGQGDTKEMLLLCGELMLCDLSSLSVSVLACSSMLNSYDKKNRGFHFHFSHHKGIELTLKNAISGISSGSGKHETAGAAFFMAAAQCGIPRKEPPKWDNHAQSQISWQPRSCWAAILIVVFILLGSQHHTVICFDAGEGRGRNPATVNQIVF